MSNGGDKKIGLILLGMGGPNKIEDIKEYIYNIFSDRSIIRLQFGPLFQKPFAKLISYLRYKKVKNEAKITEEILIF